MSLERYAEKLEIQGTHEISHLLHLFLRSNLHACQCNLLLLDIATMMFPLYSTSFKVTLLKICCNHSIFVYIIYIQNIYIHPLFKHI